MWPPTVTRYAGKGSRYNDKPYDSNKATFTALVGKREYSRHKVVHAYTKWSWVIIASRAHAWHQQHHDKCTLKAVTRLAAVVTGAQLLATGSEAAALS